MPLPGVFRAEAELMLKESYNVRLPSRLFSLPPRSAALDLKSPFNINLFFHLGHSRACWVSFIATSTSLYCRTELYNLMCLQVKILGFSVAHAPGTFGETSSR